MNANKYVLILLIVGTLGSCAQPNADTTGSDTTSTNTTITDTTALDTPGAEHVPLAQVIVPGISIGQTTLNESAENIIKRIGKPDASDAAMGKSLSTWYAKHNTAGYQTQLFFSRQMGVDETSRVKQIRITSPWFKTAGALHVGTPFKNLFANFKLSKVATYREKGTTYAVYDDENAGIAFETDDKDLCSGIIVHEPKTTVTANYAAFHPTTKLLK
jgi:hypothetical protein